MPSHQHIFDRLQELERAVITASRSAAANARASQRAERQQLRDDCAVSGHVLQPRNYAGDVKQCAICGYCDDEPAATTAANLSKG